MFENHFPLYIFILFVEDGLIDSLPSWKARAAVTGEPFLIRLVLLYHAAFSKFSLSWLRFTAPVPLSSLFKRTGRPLCISSMVLN